MTNQKVSVILTVLNEANGLTRLLDALVSQSQQPDEIMIVDGGSTDGTVATLQRYGTLHPFLKYHVEAGVNIARGRNIGIARAMGDIIAVTDGGCLPDKDWLRELVKPLLKDNTLDAVAGALKVDAHNRFEFFAGMLSLPPIPTENESPMFYGRSSAFRRRLFDTVGGYPEWLYTAEDSLFAKQALAMNFQTTYAPSSVLNWRPRPNLKKLAKMFFLYGKGQGRINKVNIKGAIWWLRLHTLWMATLLIGFIYPAAWLVTLITLIYLYKLMVLPQLQFIRASSDDLWREIWAPLIIFTRNLSTNIGSLVGAYEYKNRSNFREQLDAYCNKKRAV